MIRFCAIKGTSIVSEFLILAIKFPFTMYGCVCAKSCETIILRFPLLFALGAGM